jgi:hypothetical protein
MAHSAHAGLSASSLIMTKSFVNIKLSAGNPGMNPMTGGLAPGSLGANGFVVSLLGTMRTRFSDSNV